LSSDGREERRLTNFGDAGVSEGEEDGGVEQEEDLGRLEITDISVKDVKKSTYLK